MPLSSSARAARATSAEAERWVWVAGLTTRRRYQPRFEMASISIDNMVFIAGRLKRFDGSAAVVAWRLDAPLPCGE
jgi:hypothetical protein